MTIELTWQMVGIAFTGIAVFGVGAGTLAFHGIKAYRKAKGLDKQEANDQMELAIKNYKELYESERDWSRQQIKVLSAEVQELRARVRQLEAEIEQYRTQNSSLQSLLCPFRSTCPWTKTEGGPPSNPNNN